MKLTKFKELDFERITPDKAGNWLNQTHNDWNELIPLCSKSGKAGKNNETIFTLYSNGVSTNRDEWVYDFDKQNLEQKMQFFYEEYNKEVDRWIQWKLKHKHQEPKAESDPVLDNFLAERNLIKWSKMIKRDKLRKHKEGVFDAKDIKEAMYRPFVKNYLYYGYLPIDIRGEFGNFFKKDNKFICFRCISADQLVVLATNNIFDLNYLKIGNGGTQGVSLYYYDDTDSNAGETVENITDWALGVFRTNFPKVKNFREVKDINFSEVKNFREVREIEKEDIFHYVYAVLHSPTYREKYAQNLKRDFPRLPLYDDFWKWAQAGKELMTLHLEYETLPTLGEVYHTPIENVLPKCKASPTYEAEQAELIKNYVPEVKLKVKEGDIEIDSLTTITGVPALAYQYKLGNRSAIEWVLDQYKPYKSGDETIAQNFQTYRFSDYKQEVIDLLLRVIYVSVRTMEVVGTL